MFATYLRRELAGRRKLTAIVAIGMALAIALVIIVNSVSSGIGLAQANVLASVYGVGTDITVNQTPAAPGEGKDGGPQRFDFDATDGTTSVSRTRLAADRGTSTFAATDLATVGSVDNVTAAATLSLTKTTFEGALPDRTAGPPAPGETPPWPPAPSVACRSGTGSCGKSRSRRPRRACRIGG